MTKNFPKIMGILNITPDSFSDGGRYSDFDSAFNKALEMIGDGVDIIDIGGESTRPGSVPVSTDVELNRVIPVIEEIRKINNTIKISIDTTKYEVAKSALYAGADIINDISGLENDVRLAELAGVQHKSLILMHMQNNPQSMQIDPKYFHVVDEVYNFLESKVILARSFNVNDIIIDVGIGFGKTLDHNLTLIKNIDHFKKLGCEILLGISRKSFIGKLLKIDNPSDRDVATALYHSVLLNSNVDIIRVHNVKLISQLKEINNSIHN